MSHDQMIVAHFFNLSGKFTYYIMLKAQKNNINLNFV